MTSPPVPHFLSLARPDAVAGPPMGVPDTTTVAAHDFDVDVRTGFMPPQQPLARLPAQWEAWESALQDAVSQKLKLAEAADSALSDREASAKWRLGVRNVCCSSPLVSKASLIQNPIATSLTD